MEAATHLVGYLLQRVVVFLVPVECLGEDRAVRLHTRVRGHPAEDFCGNRRDQGPDFFHDPLTNELAPCLDDWALPVPMLYDQIVRVVESQERRRMTKLAESLIVACLLSEG